MRLGDVSVIRVRANGTFAEYARTRCPPLKRHNAERGRGHRYNRPEINPMMGGRSAGLDAYRDPRGGPRGAGSGSSVIEYNV